MKKIEVNNPDKNKKLLDLVIKHNLYHALDNGLLTKNLEDVILYHCIFNSRLKVIDELVEVLDNKKEISKKIIEVVLDSKTKIRSENTLIKKFIPLIDSINITKYHLFKWFEKNNNVPYSKPNFKMLNWLNKQTDYKYLDNGYLLHKAIGTNNSIILDYVLSLNPGKEYSFGGHPDNDKIYKIYLNTYNKNCSNENNLKVLNHFKNETEITQYIRQCISGKNYELAAYLIEYQLTDEDIKGIDNVDKMLMLSSFPIDNLDTLKYFKERNLIVESTCVDFVKKIKRSNNIDTEFLLYLISEIIPNRPSEIIPIFDYVFENDLLDDYKKIESKKEFSINESKLDGYMLVKSLFNKNKSPKILNHILSTDTKIDVIDIIERYKEDTPNHEKVILFTKYMYEFLLTPKVDEVKKLKI